MPNRIISSGILTSDSLSKLSWFDQCVFFRLLVLADDYGRYDARPAVIRGQAFPLYDVTNKDIQAALSRLAAVGIIGLYEVGGRSYLQLEHWNSYQRVRNSKEKYPAPPKKCSDMQIRRELPRVAASCGLNPNPNPNTPLPPTGELFGEFWTAYPRKVGKANCQKWFEKHKVDRKTLDAMLTSIAYLKTTEQWKKDDGKFIPYPQTWLNGRRWEDETAQPPKKEVTRWLR